MKRQLFTLLACAATSLLFAQEEVKWVPKLTEQWEPEVVIVQPGEQPGLPPADAIVLFDGKDIDKEWVNKDGGKPGWIVADDCVTVVKGAGIIRTRREFADCQLHIEWRTPATVVGEGQGRGNSGIFLQERYELQVLDNFENKTYCNGQAGSIYKQTPPLANACRKPGEWQTYDIIFTAPRFNADSSLFSPAYITVLQNGVLIQNHTQIRGRTEFIGLPRYECHGKGAIILQDHGNPVSFRNIWIRELN